MVYKSIRISSDLYKKIHAQRLQEKRTLSGQLDRMLEAYFKVIEKEDKKKK